MSINVQDLSFKYTKDQELVLKDVSFDINKGEKVALMGLSGSGKSTILKILLGFLDLNNADIKIDDLKLSKNNIKGCQSKLSYIPQSGGLYPHMKNRDNILLPAKVKKILDQKVEDRLKEYAKLCNVTEDVLNKFPKDVSGGQRQRIALLRSLVNSKDYLFLDEPFSALDSITKQTILNEFKTIFQNEKKTILLVTHSLKEASKLCDKVILLKDGCVDTVQDIDEFSNSPATDYAKKFVLSQKL